MRRALVVAAWLALAGCGTSVEAICGDLAEECSGVDEASCRREGLDLEEVAENVECEPSFDAHLDCVEEAMCGWETACADSLEELQRCVTRQ